MMTLEQAIASYEKSAERYHKAFLHCKSHGGEFYQEEAESNKMCYEHDRQLAAWLRELQERRKADSETERGSARWLINSDGYYPYCSACMKEPKDGKMTDVCPSCGARMDGKIT